MATLIFGALGRAIAGPIGGILGTGLGGVLDRAILGGGGGSPGRVADLAVQSAAYGEPIPIVHGRMRVAGNLIWTSGIAESRARGGGKAAPRTAAMHYSASFAVGLTARAIADVGRIWADGRLLRDADGEFASPVTMRLHRGDERQAVDPLIAAAEGAAGAPAYRGLAYAVFEDLPLADYGNRIPNLMFEIIADRAESIDMGAILVALAGNADVSRRGDFPAVAGHAANRAGSRGEAMAGLFEISGAALAAGESLVLQAGAGGHAAIEPGDMDAHVPGTRPRPERRQHHPAGTAAGVEIGFYDRSRDYQIGLQRVRRSAASGPMLQRAIAATMLPADAKALAAAVLARHEAGRVRATVRLPWRHLDKTPGSLLRLRDDASLYRVVSQRFEQFLVSLDLERVATVPLPPPASDGGRPARFDDGPPGPTAMQLLDLPPLPGDLPAGPRMWVAAAGAAPAWRRAAIAVSSDGGASFGDAGTAPMATVGTTLTALPAGNVAAWDGFGAVDVELLSDAMWLEPRPTAAVLAGANLALVGEEILQFARVEALGGRRFRLAGLLRGRRGTEAAVAGHRAGERFVLLDPASLLPIDPGIDAIGATLLVRPQGAGDAAAPGQAVVVAGRALAPLSPVHLRLALVGGDVHAAWCRRSRAGFAWTDFIDAPLAEARERYRIVVTLDGRVVRQIESGTPACVYTAADRVADGGGARVGIAVAQLSDVVGPGVAATASIG